jgi:hypothetical protein
MFGLDGSRELLEFRSLDAGLCTAAALTGCRRTPRTFGQQVQERAYAFSMPQLSLSVDLKPGPLTISSRHACLRNVTSCEQALAARG